MRYLAKTINNFDLVDGVDGRGKATMDAEDLVIDDHAKGKEIEHVGEIVPDIRITIFA